MKFKYIIIGDAQIGKSSIINRYVNNSYEPDYQSTVGVEFAIYSYKKDGKNYDINIWDLAGQEKYKSILRNYYKDVDAIFIVFDMKNFQSFLHVKSWYKSITEYYDLERDDIYNPIIYLLGNKCDGDNWKIDTQINNTKIGKMMDKKKIKKYYECSAKTNYNIEKIFFEINEDVYRNAEKYDRLYEAKNRNRVEVIQIGEGKKRKYCYCRLV